VKDLGDDEKEVLTSTVWDAVTVLMTIMAEGYVIVIVS
jgi:hypothetical protein